METMDLKHKHWALIFIGILVAILVVIAAYYMLGTKKAVAPTSTTATSTMPTSTTTAVAAPEAHITEHGQYYDIDMTYPSATPLVSLSATADENAVNTMKAAMQDTADQFVKDGNFADLPPEEIQMMQDSGQKESLSTEYKTYTGSHTVSYVFAIFEDTLGAHPNTVYQTFTFDTQTGDKLDLSDLFTTSTNYPSVLSGIAIQQLPSIIASREQVSTSDVDMDFITAGAGPKIENFQDWYISGGNLVLIFPPYQVGPYVLGTVELPIPLSSLSSLRATYQSR